MARLSMNELTTFRWSFEEDVQNYAAAGIPAIGVWREKISDFGEEKAIELLSDSGLAVASLHWAGGFTGSDGRSYKESLEDAREAIRLAAAIKAETLLVYTGSRAGHTHNHARRLIRNAIAELVPAATDARLTLTVEPMHAGCAAEWTFLTSLDDATTLLDAVGSPNVKLALDTYHFGHDPAAVSQLPAIASRVGIVHLGDGRRPPDGEQNRCPLGDGTVPLRDIVASLSAAGYDGTYEVELMGEDMEAVSYGDLVAESKRAFESLLAD